MTDSAPLKHTPLHHIHVALGGKMVPFAGYDMPVQYPTGIMAEHQAVRTGIGVFDVSHMGEFEVTGPDRNAFVNRVTTNDVGALEPGGVQYSAILNDQGTFVDDCTVYRFDDKIMIVVNAANRAAAWEHIVNQKGGANVRLKDISDDVGLLAVQGPGTEAALQPLSSVTLAGIGYYRVKSGRIAGLDCFISRTGYTGEDGFELYVPGEQSPALWTALLDAVTARGGTAAGLACRDTLRLEAGMALYGHELTMQTNPYEAGLGKVVRLNKDFVGRDALQALSEAPVERVLVGLRGEGRRAARAEYPVYADDGDTVVGVVTSGALSPTLGYPISLAYVDAALAEPGTELTVDIRGRREPFVVTASQFYRRG